MHIRLVDELVTESMLLHLTSYHQVLSRWAKGNWKILRKSDRHILGIGILRSSDHHRQRSKSSQKPIDWRSRRQKISPQVAMIWTRVLLELDHRGRTYWQLFRLRWRLPKYLFLVNRYIVPPLLLYAAYVISNWVTVAEVNMFYSRMSAISERNWLTIPSDLHFWSQRQSKTYIPFYSR